MKRQFVSGASKRKKSKSEAQLVAQLPKLTGFFAQPPGPSQRTGEAPLPQLEVDEPGDASPTAADETAPIAGATPRATPTLVQLSDDPAVWPEAISRDQRIDIVTRGPKQIDTEFPAHKEDKMRRFSSTHYRRTLPNGERIRRTWLVYSKSKDEIFYFACKLFDTADVPLRKGACSWMKLSKRLKEHESGVAHRNAMIRWTDLRQGLRTGTTIDAREAEAFRTEKGFWRAVVSRLIDVTSFLASRNLSFRGHDQALGSTSNGNFLGIVELMSKYDPGLSSLIRRVQTSQTADHYLSGESQNEFISVISDCIVDKNRSKIQKSKYYSIVLDCTPDISHQEQMSIVLRSVSCNHGGRMEINEHFFGFLPVGSTMGEDLLEVLLQKLEQLGLNIGDCRGQSYDNGANMTGKQKGVQARLLDRNPKALFMPCAAHTLNLLIADAARCSQQAVHFFGTISRLYTIFSSSTARWAILKSKVPITLKEAADTRWDSWLASIKPLRYHFAEVIEALEELEGYANGKRDGTTAVEARSLADNIASWPFLMCVAVWYDVLYHVDKVSKTLQSSTASLDLQQSELAATLKFLQRYRNTGWNDAQLAAGGIAEELDVEKIFPQTRQRRKKRQFDYESVDSAPTSAEDLFKADFFAKIVDQAIMSITERFKQTTNFRDIFGFLYTRATVLGSCEDRTLADSCKHFKTTVGEGDVDDDDLHREIERFAEVLLDPKNGALVSAPDFLQYLCENDLFEVYPNLGIALRILLTLPVTVASAERSFSKLKLIKSFSRSTMSDQRLSGLALISIEQGTLMSLQKDELIEAFASKKVRRKPL